MLRILAVLAVIVAGQIALVSTQPRQTKSCADQLREAEETNAGYDTISEISVACMLNDAKPPP
jgi:hypothetical protein